jgi:hypothetical protein
MITLDFLFAVEARFGYGADGSDVRGGVLPAATHGLFTGTYVITESCNQYLMMNRE